jgi:hypothetical protein
VVACANPWKLLGDWVYVVVDEIMNVVKLSDISLCAYSAASIIHKTVTNYCRSPLDTLFYPTFCPVLLEIESELRCLVQGINYIYYALHDSTTAGDCPQLASTGV